MCKVDLLVSFHCLTCKVFLVFSAFISILQHAQFFLIFVFGVLINSLALLVNIDHLENTLVLSLTGFLFVPCCSPSFHSVSYLIFGWVFTQPAFVAMLFP